MRRVKSTRLQRVERVLVRAPRRPTVRRPLRCFAVRASSSDRLPQRTHYQVLGVQATATAREIKSAYRRLALKLHPDVNKHDPHAQERFTTCNIAYDVLSDAAKRKDYDAELALMAGVLGAPWDMETPIRRRGPQAPRSRQHAPSRVQDEEDDDDDVTEAEVAYELEYQYWAATSSNYRSSFTASWSGKNGRRRRAAEAQRMAQPPGADGAAAGPGKGRGGSGKRGGSRAGLDGIDMEQLLDALGPEVRATAKHTFGNRLERLQSVDELQDFLEVMATLRDDMGVTFEVFSSSEAEDTVQRQGRREQTGGRGRGGKRSARQAPQPPRAASASPPPLSQASMHSDGVTGRQRRARRGQRSKQRPAGSRDVRQVFADPFGDLFVLGDERGSNGWRGIVDLDGSDSEEDEWDVDVWPRVQRDHEGRVHRAWEW